MGAREKIGPDAGGSLSAALRLRTGKRDGKRFMSDVLIGVIVGLIIVGGIPGIAAFVTLIRSSHYE